MTKRDYLRIDDRMLEPESLTRWLRERTLAYMDFGNQAVKVAWRPDIMAVDLIEYLKRGEPR